MMKMTDPPSLLQRGYEDIRRPGGRVPGNQNARERGFDLIARCSDILRTSRQAQPDDLIA